MARQGRITGRVLAGAAAIAVVASGALATSASAHVPSITATCSTVTVDLKDYNAKAQNTVSVSLAGKQLINLQAFGSTFHQVFQVPAHTSPEEADLVVYTSEDPKGDNHWTGTWKVTVPVCETPPPTPPVSPTPPASPTPSPSHSAPSSPSPSPTTPAPTTPAPTTPAPSTPAPTKPAPTTPAASPTPAAPVSASPSVAPVVATTPAAPKPSSTSPSLAFTGGGSSAGPIAAAGAAVIALGGGLLFLNRRKKAARH
ncbi:LPXTG cell wall anchor domain-containing protein [Kitasatospora kifunensis]|uniref:LPXTG-motif cell wall-anchored protein n=1 Tax=Kitasatospora kifunensis TaxID=58351 RepID=A0A7W7VXQ5_KITKI|nr:LPXTG cell wall anchor domain-containing protein [Kitasatospora kifunensis]MBB4925845.1 LPXTG-motif cell wall-anchored protein [Kitasatospora kifunensis]